MSVLLTSLDVIVIFGGSSTCCVWYSIEQRLHCPVAANTIKAKHRAAPP